MEFLTERKNGLKLITVKENGEPIIEIQEGSDVTHISIYRLNLTSSRAYYALHELIMEMTRELFHIKTSHQERMEEAAKDRT